MPLPMCEIVSVIVNRGGHAGRLHMPPVRARAPGLVVRFEVARFQLQAFVWWGGGAHAIAGILKRAATITHLPNHDCWGEYACMY